MNKRLIRILILEDDIDVVAILLRKIQQLEFEAIKSDKELAVVVLQESELVQRYINTDQQTTYDIILLDRDDNKGNGSFHVLDFNKCNLDNIISISSVADWNDMAKIKGVKRIVLKDYANLEGFVDKVAEEIKKIIGLEKAEK